jgi:hypothetical protein
LDNFPRTRSGDVTWAAYREPFPITLARTGAIAIAGGAALARWLGGLAHWPMATLLVLWPALGGHFVELWFLNYLRPRLPAARAAQAGARIAVWCAGGIVLGRGMRLTAMALASYRPRYWPVWWFAGPAFIGIELAAHLVLHLRGRPSFYNGRG